MSQEGVQEFGLFASAKDPNVNEPLFIAQYLLAPVNTIVKDSLLPWMMKQDGPPTTQPARLKKSFKYQAREIKAELYLKYNLIVEYLQVVTKYGQSYDYNFETDDQLTLIKTGMFSDQSKNNITQIMISINSFMTIWLLTVPEKFKEWFEKHDGTENTSDKAGSVMSIGDNPTFSILETEMWTTLV